MPSLVTIVYCTVGGVEAVIWSDFVQALILIASTVLIMAVAICGSDGGFSGFVSSGLEAGKFRVFDLAFDWTRPCFWVVFAGGIVANLASYTSDQCVVQRYMTTPDEKGGAKSILLNGALSFVNCFVFFAMGVALWSFYRSHAGALPPGVKRLAGLPPHAFLLKQRILRAKRMLLSQMPVSAIAHQLGFSSSQHFSSQFKSATGMSPTAYAERKSEISNAIP